ncbi:alpha-1,4-glucan--maltose-1-phosphate maltosyltransferase [Methyloligella solikamskensis]|uniref:Alpha-1,4-glucan:maltose-1-phosphate maltosyltransferase n=1 Tax=Methyloligella solikamskensis TaxID=1177756 RepID=A0ABW3J979_9HYPH
MPANTAAPRIYALPGPMAGQPNVASPYLKRAAEMGFDWILFGPLSDPKRDRDAIKEIASDAQAKGLKLMLRLTPDSTGDLPAWKKAGADGVMLSSARTMSAKDWIAKLSKLDTKDSDLLVLADSLGRSPKEQHEIAKCGIGWLLNSFAWWDLRESWFLDQQRDIAPLARTVATPEPWPGPRLIHRLMHFDPATIADIYATQYRLAATVSSGILCPFGFEFGASAPLDDKGYRAVDWERMQEKASFEITDAIGEINRLKAKTPALQSDAQLERASAPDASVVALSKSASTKDGSQTVVTLANMSAVEAPLPAHAELARAADANADFKVVAPKGSEGLVGSLPPYEGAVLLAETKTTKPKPPKAGKYDQRLQELATNRVVIEGVAPEVDGGRFPIKRVLGETLHIEADIFMDGHDIIDGCLCYRHIDEDTWHETPMRPLVNDRWEAEFTLDRIGRYFYFVQAWKDAYRSWRAGVMKKLEAEQKVAVDLAVGLRLIGRYMDSAPPETREAMRELLTEMETLGDKQVLAERMVSEETMALMDKAGHRENLSRHLVDYQVYVDRPLAANAAWYELMPRSQSGDAERHGTFDDVIGQLPYVRDLGFDVLYFPPIHPIGQKNRKGKNNSLDAKPGDPGSPYAIGSKEGGHDALHPELGSFEDFSRLIEAARAYDLEIAIDFAIQCSPDHPWIKQHPEWFDWRPDGTIQYAENPPKKYEDIVPPHFYGKAFPDLWLELRDIVLFWAKTGVRIFRVDNPHTKPVPFWEWMIAEVQDAYPDCVFLAEAFTRPKMMKRLAKIGFTQSYSYFTWRNEKHELIEYLTELTTEECREYMRPNFFANTPDINPVYLQENGRAGHQVRLALAATLSPLYGLYNGYEICEATPMPGKEEYLNSEKYELRVWDFDQPENIKDDIQLINRIRRDNPALWQFTDLTFLNAWNDNILCYYKCSAAKDNLVVVAVNLDAQEPQGASFEIPLWEFGLPDDAAIEAVDLVHDSRQTFSGKTQSVWLDPADRPYAIWRLIPPGSARN